MSSNFPPLDFSLLSTNASILQHTWAEIEHDLGYKNEHDNSKAQLHDTSNCLGRRRITGIAWEIGVLTGLLEAGVTLHEADTIIGTSAGAFFGVALASGYDMNKLFAAQSDTSDSEIPAAADKHTIAARLPCSPPVQPGFVAVAPGMIHPANNKSAHTSQILAVDVCVHEIPSII